MCASTEIVNYMRDIGLSTKEYVAIGSSNLSLEVFIIISQKARLLAGSVICFVSEEINRYSSFHDFFSSMITYNERIAAKMKSDFG